MTFFSYPVGQIFVGNSLEILYYKMSGIWDDATTIRIKDGTALTTGNVAKIPCQIFGQFTISHFLANPDYCLELFIAVCLEHVFAETGRMEIQRNGEWTHNRQDNLHTNLSIFRP